MSIKIKLTVPLKLFRLIIFMIFRKRAGIQQSMNSISKELELGDWKLLNVLSYNMAPIVLGEFITELAAQVYRRTKFITELAAQVNRRTWFITELAAQVYRWT